MPPPCDFHRMITQRSGSTKLWFWVNTFLIQKDVFVDRHGGWKTMYGVIQKLRWQDFVLFLTHLPDHTFDICKPIMLTKIDSLWTTTYPPPLFCQCSFWIDSSVWVHRFTSYRNTYIQLDKKKWIVFVYLLDRLFRQDLK